MLVRVESAHERTSLVQPVVQKRFIVPRVDRGEIIGVFWYDIPVRILHLQVVQREVQLHREKDRRMWARGNTVGYAKYLFKA